MPDSIKLGAFVFGSILILIAILGGNFKFFGADVAASVSNPFLRFVAFTLGAFMLVLSIGWESGNLTSSDVPTTSQESPSHPLSSSPPVPANEMPVSQVSPSPKSPSITELKPGEWRGEKISRSGERTPMILFITEVQGTNFVGEIRTQYSSPIVVEGEIVQDFGNVAEQSYWKFIEGFGTDRSGIWLAFYIRSNWPSDVKFYPTHLKNDGTMVGVEFGYYDKINPESYFELALVP